MCVCVCVCVCIFSKSRFSLQDFHIFQGEFCYLPGGKFTARSHPRNFFKISNFPW